MFPPCEVASQNWVMLMRNSRNPASSTFPFRLFELTLLGGTRSNHFLASATFASPLLPFMNANSLAPSELQLTLGGKFPSDSYPFALLDVRDPRSRATEKRTTPSASSPNCIAPLSPLSLPEKGIRKEPSTLSLSGSLCPSLPSNSSSKLSTSLGPLHQVLDLRPCELPEEETFHPLF